MPLHLIKLCVGCDTPEDLSKWQRQRLAALRQAGTEAQLMHVTRQTPRREGISTGSSLYWVIGGFIRARQAIRGLSEVEGEDGVSRCGILLDPRLVLTDPVPRRPFQGWRYLSADEAPADLSRVAPPSDAAISPAMRAALVELRLI